MLVNNIGILQISRSKNVNKPAIRPGEALRINIIQILTNHNHLLIHSKNMTIPRSLSKTSVPRSGGSVVSVSDS